MAFPTITTALDQFTDTNGTALNTHNANWSISNFSDSGLAAQIQDNAATGRSGYDSMIMYWNVANYTNTEVYVTSKATGAGGDAYIGACWNDTNGTGYVLSLNETSDGWSLVRCDDLSTSDITFLDSGTQAINNGASIGLEVKSGKVRAYYKASGGSWGALSDEVSDSTYTSGRIALFIYLNSERLDDFTGGEIISGGSGGSMKNVVMVW